VERVLRQQYIMVKTAAQQVRGLGCGMISNAPGMV
jgi:hypothetical protein